MKSTNRSQSSIFQQQSIDSTEASGSLKIEELLTTEEVANFLKVSVGVVRNMTSNGKLPYHKIGKRNRYVLQDLQNLLLQNRRGVLHGNKN